jgi:hypothetical protein
VSLMTTCNLTRVMQHAKNSGTCGRICMDRDLSVLFMPCRHLVSCRICSASVRVCPVCRAAITATIDVFMP